MGSLVDSTGKKTTDIGTRPRPPNVAEHHLDGFWGQILPVAHTRQLRVLIADDDADAADSLALLVRLWGHDVHTVYSGRDALTMIFACMPNVLVLDIAMPKIDGFSLARSIRQQFCLQGVLLIALTGYADLAHRQFGMEAGFDHYLAKPADLDAFERMLRLEQERLFPARRQIPPSTSRPGPALED